MAVPSVALDRPSGRAILRPQDVASPAATAFARICEVEKWPVWLSFLRSARLTETHLPFGAGREVANRSALAWRRRRTLRSRPLHPGFSCFAGRCVFVPAPVRFPGRAEVRTLEGRRET